MADTRELAAAIDAGRFASALDQILNESRTRDSSWVITKLRRVASVCPEARRDVLEPYAERVRRIFEEADRLDELPGVFRAPSSRRGDAVFEAAARFPVAALDESRGPGTVLTLWVRTRRGGLGGRFVGQYVPAKEFQDAVEAAHALWAPIRPGLLERTEWGIAPDVSANTGLVGGSAALAASVAMVAHILRVEPPANRAYTGVLCDGRFEPPALDTLGGKLLALAKEGGRCRYLYSPRGAGGRVDISAGVTGVSLEWVDRPDHIALMALLLNQPEEDVRRMLGVPSLPPPEGEPRVLELELRLLELLAAAAHPMRPELLREAAGQAESWDRALDVPLDAFDRALGELLRRSVVVATDAPAHGAFAQVYSLAPKLDQKDGPQSTTGLRRRMAHRALQMLGEDTVYHAILAGASDAAREALADSSTERFPLERCRNFVREVEAARAVDEECVREFLAKLEKDDGRGLVADLALLALSGRSLSSPFGRLARAVGEAHDARELLFVLQAWLEAVLHGTLLLTLLETDRGAADTERLESASKLLAQPSLGALMHTTRRLAQAKSSGPASTLAEALVSAFGSDVDPAAALNQRLHGIGKWAELCEVGAEASCLEAAAVLARAMARMLGPLRDSLLVGWSPGAEGWHMLRDGRLALGLMRSDGDTEYMLRSLRDGVATYWSFSGPCQTRARLLPAGAPVSLTALASALPEASHGHSAALRPEPRAVALNTLPQPVARCLAQLKRHANDPLRRMSAIDTAFGALVRICLFACSEASVRGGSPLAPASAERLTRRTALATLARYCARGEAGLGGELARGLAGDHAGPLAWALVDGLERATHSPMSHGAFRAGGPLARVADELERLLRFVVACTPWAGGGVSMVGVGQDASWALDGYHATLPGTPPRELPGGRVPEGVYVLRGDERLPLGVGACMRVCDGAPSLLLAENPRAGTITWFFVAPDGVRRCT